MESAATLSRFAGQVVALRSSKMLPPTPFIPSPKERASVRRNRCRLREPVRLTVLMERPTESLPVPAKNSLRNFRDTAMRSARKQLAGFDGPLKPLPAILVLVAALAVALVPLARAADSPGETLKRPVEAAKAFLDAGDLLQAGSQFPQPPPLRFRQ